MQSTAIPADAPLTLVVDKTLVAEGTDAAPRVDPPVVAFLRQACTKRPGLVVFSLALLARLFVLALFSGSPHFGVQSGDMRFYHDWALRILGGQLTDHKAFYGLPGYAYLLAGVYKVFGVTPGVVLLLQAVADALTATLIFKLAYRVITPSRPWLPEILAGLASLGWVLFIPAQAFSAVLMPTVLATACFWFAVQQATRPGATCEIWRWLGVGVLIGVMAMLVATVLFAVPLLVGAFVFSSSLWPRRAACVALLIAGVAIGTAPAWLHNRLLAHEPVFLSAHSGINFWVGNGPEADGYPKIPAGLRAGQQELLEDSVAVAQKAVGRQLTRAEVSNYWSEKASLQIRQHPVGSLRLLALKVKNFWNAFEYDDVTIIALLREEGVLLPGISFGFVASLGAAGLVLAFIEKRGAQWIAAAVLLQMAALMPVFITERYRLAAVPGLLILGAYLLGRVHDMTVARRWRPLGIAGLLVCAATLLVHLPTSASALQSMEPYNLAISELEVNQLERAERHLAIAQKSAPENPSLLFALGTLSLKKGDTGHAKEYYKRTLQKDPQNAAAYTNLGIIAFGEKRWELACRFFRAALTIAPQDGDTRGLLQRAEKELTAVR